MCCNFSCCASIASCLVSSFQTSLHTCSPHDLDDLNVDSTYRNFLAQVPQEDPIVAGKRACDGYLLSSVATYSYSFLTTCLSCKGHLVLSLLHRGHRQYCHVMVSQMTSFSTFFDRSLSGSGTQQPACSIDNTSSPLLRSVWRQQPRRRK